MLPSEFAGTQTRELVNDGLAATKIASPKRAEALRIIKAFIGWASMKYLVSGKKVPTATEGRQNLLKTDLLSEFQ